METRLTQDNTIRADRPRVHSLPFNVLAQVLVGSMSDTGRGWVIIRADSGDIVRVHDPYSELPDTVAIFQEDTPEWVDLQHRTTRRLDENEVISLRNTSNT